MTKDLRAKVLDSTSPRRKASDYKTTSFTLLKLEYAAFKDACRASDRMPSEVLRTLVATFTRQTLEAGNKPQG